MRICAGAPLNIFRVVHSASQFESLVNHVAIHIARHFCLEATASSSSSSRFTALAERCESGGAALEVVASRQKCHGMQTATRITHESIEMLGARPLRNLEGATEHKALCALHMELWDSTIIHNTLVHGSILAYPIPRKSRKLQVQSPKSSMRNRTEGIKASTMNLCR